MKQEQSRHQAGVGDRSKSKRVGESDTSLPQRSRDLSKLGQGSRNVSPTHAMGGQLGFRQTQEALKNQGHDPWGPIGGGLRSQIRQTFRAFQSAFVS